jgi:NAD(P)H dehydrogenase (quinone)
MEPLHWPIWPTALAESFGRPVAYRKRTTAHLIDHGIPEMVERMIAESDSATMRGAVFDDSRTLRALIRPAVEPV